MNIDQDASHSMFADSHGEVDHSGLCTSASVINSLGGVGGFGRASSSGQAGKRTRQGWWGGLGVGSGWDCPMPRIKTRFNISQEEFQQRKKRRIEEMRKPAPLPPAAIETKASAPQNHEVAGFMPGRLEFDHEVENEAELVIKDMDFGLVWAFGGDEMQEGKAPSGGRDGIDNENGDAADGDDNDDDDDDEQNATTKPGRPAQQQSSKTVSGTSMAGKKAGGKGKSSKQPAASQTVTASDTPHSGADTMDVDAEDADTAVEPPKLGRQTSKDPKPDAADDPSTATDAATPILEVEDPEDMKIKLTVLEIYYERLGIRRQVKDFIFSRGLMDYKRLTTLEKKRKKEEAGLVNRYKVFAKLQTAEDFEVLVDGLIWEQTLRRRIAELQDYRRNGITTAADAQRFEKLRHDRVSAGASSSDSEERERELDMLMLT